MDGFLKTHLFFYKRINGTEKVGGGWTTEMTWGGDGWFTEEVGEQGGLVAMLERRWRAGLSPERGKWRERW